MKLSLKNREAIRAISPVLEAEFDGMMSTITQTFTREHTYDGKHFSVEQPSLTQVLEDNPMFHETMVEDVSFGSQELSHALDISRLGVIDVKEIFILPLGPLQLCSSGATQPTGTYQIWVAKPTSTTSITIKRTVNNSTDGASASSSGSDVDLLTSTHAFFVGRLKL